MSARRHTIPLSLVAVCALVTSCVANPGPPPIETGQEAESSASAVAGAHERDDDAAHEPAAEEKDERDDSATESKVGVGIDPIHFGLNPHLRANQQAVVDDIAALVLPSAFLGDETTELLETAEEIPVAAADDASAGKQPVVQRVRYTIDAQAQWSDGTPITGEDFIYLWKSMVSTPGVVGAAGYFAIADITSSAGGRIVDVEFSHRVADWRGLFHNLLPAHLMTVPFAQARELPAGAGRYQVDGVDWARGKIILHRNDRFWGAEPANIDVVELTEIRTPAQGLNLMRSGQVSFVDITPQETTFAAYGALPGTQVFRFNTPRQLRMDLTLRSSVFLRPEARAEFFDAINIPELAVYAAGRRTDLRIPGFGEDAAHVVDGVDAAADAAVQKAAGGADLEENDELAVLREHTGDERPLRIAADPADSVASAAAAAVVDRMVARGVHAEVVADDFASLSADLVPEGEVDAVLSWDDTTASALAIADDLLCRASHTATAKAGWIPRCLPDNADAWTDILSGELDPAGGQAQIASLRDERTLFIPIIDERRIRVLGSGIIGPSEAIASWPAGLKTLPQWQLTAQTELPH